MKFCCYGLVLTSLISFNAFAERNYSVAIGDSKISSLPDRNWYQDQTTDRGYSFNLSKKLYQYLDVELSFSDLGSYGQVFQPQVSLYDLPHNDPAYNKSIKSIGLLVSTQVPITSHIFVRLSAGLARYKDESYDTNWVLNPINSQIQAVVKQTRDYESGEEYKAGFYYDLLSNVSMGLSYGLHKSEQVDVSTTSLEIVYQF